MQLANRMNFISYFITFTALSEIANIYYIVIIGSSFFFFRSSRIRWQVIVNVQRDISETKEGLFLLLLFFFYVLFCFAFQANEPRESSHLIYKHPRQCLNAACTQSFFIAMINKTSARSNFFCCVFGAGCFYQVKKPRLLYMFQMFSLRKKILLHFTLRPRWIQGKLIEIPIGKRSVVGERKRNRKVDLSIERTKKKNWLVSLYSNSGKIAFEPSGVENSSGACKHTHTQ